MFSAAFDIFQKGGPIMWLILTASIVAVGVFIERTVFFHRNTASLDVFLNGISNLLRQGKYQEALQHCDALYGPVPRVVRAAILKRHLPKHELREIVQEIAQLQVPHLESNLRILATIGAITPLLGFLGTVLGMIHAFMTINHAMGAVPVGDLAEGIWEALITTAGGLVVAIPCYMAYNFLASRVHTLITDMERATIEIIQVLSETPADTKPQPLQKVR